MKLLSHFLPPSSLQISNTSTTMADKHKSHTKKPKHKHPNNQTTNPTTTAAASAAAAADTAFKPSSTVKGIKFGAQFILKSFTIRRSTSLQLLRLLNLPPHHHPFSSTTAFLPSNFTILAHHALHTLTLGLGTHKSKVVLFVFESESLRAALDGIFPREIPLGEVNKKLIRGLSGCEMARFKFRKGCITFYVYAVRAKGKRGFECAEDLRLILQAVVGLKDFLDHTAMLALPNQRSINYGPHRVAMAH